MTINKIRVGIVGAGANARLRHIPGLREIKGVEITAVCNRRADSTAAAAREFGIAKTYGHWEELVADRDIDAVVIGTWPYLHCPITLAALEAGKHVMTEARMSMNAAEAHRMLDAAKRQAQLVSQIVPSPFGLKGNRYVKKLIEDGCLGNIREVHVYGRSGQLADSATPLSWRQDARLSGLNMLTLGIVQETLQRWLPAPVQVRAQVQAVTPMRIDPESGVQQQVGTPDSVQALVVLEKNIHATYHFSGVTPFGAGTGVYLFGSAGALHYNLETDALRGSFSENKPTATGIDELTDLPIPEDLAGTWRVEADFISAIREGTTIELTDFASGVAYMEFTEAVARSAELDEAVALPLAEFLAK